MAVFIVTRNTPSDTDKCNELQSKVDVHSGSGDGGIVVLLCTRTNVCQWTVADEFSLPGIFTLLWCARLSARIRSALWHTLSDADVAAPLGCISRAAAGTLDINVRIRSDSKYIHDSIYLILTTLASRDTRKTCRTQTHSTAACRHDTAVAAAASAAPPSVGRRPPRSAH